MAELDEYLARAERRFVQRQTGAGHERLGVLNYSPQWENWAHGLPSYGNNQTALQDPVTGKFTAQTGIDGTPADPLGRT